MRGGRKKIAFQFPAAAIPEQTCAREQAALMQDGYLQEVRPKLSDTAWFVRKPELLPLIHLLRQPHTCERHTDYLSAKRFLNDLLEAVDCSLRHLP